MSRFLKVRRSPLQPPMVHGGATDRLFLAAAGGAGLPVGVKEITVRVRGEADLALDESVYTANVELQFCADGATPTVRPDAILWMPGGRKSAHPTVRPARHIQSSPAEISGATPGLGDHPRI